MHYEDHAPPPWRLAADRPWYPHLALFIRDACRLEPAQRELYPPNLESELPDLRGLLDESMRSTANRQWSSWWGKIIDFSARLGLVLEPQESAAIVQAMAQATDQFLARVTSSATEASSEAAENMRLITMEAKRWFHRISGDVSDRPENRSSHTIVVDWNLVSSIASDVLQRLNPLSQTITVGIIQLDVVGSWAEVHDAGVLLGSKDFFQNEDKVRPILTEAFLRAATSPRIHAPSLLNIPDQNAVRPTSQLVAPHAIGPVGTAILVLKEVLKFEDGFEIHLRLEGDELPSEMNEIVDDSRSRLAPNQEGRIDVFDGLQLEIEFHDGGNGRTSGTIETPRFNDGRGDLISNRFFRPPNDPRDIWLWISPLPPLGEVRLNAVWPKYGITNASVSFNVR